MSSLIPRAYVTLTLFDFYLMSGNFGALYRKVRDCHRARTEPQSNITETVCRAVDLACIWYPKEVLCLQRSAATAYMLKRCGVSADLVIGAQLTPLRAHAWVEVDGHVVNDKTYMTEIYAVLDRC